MSRRSLAKGVAWSAPAVVVAGAAPAYAASRECDYTVSFVPNATSGTQTLTATIPSGSPIQVTATVTSRTGRFSPSNMTVGTNVRSGGSCPTFTSPGVNFAATGLVLNQGGSGTCGTNSLTAASQTVSFTFRDSAGALVTPTSGTMTIMDISSHSTAAAGGYWKGYWDEVRFSSTATSVSGSTGAPALKATSGTTFYPATKDNPSPSDEWTHTFTFASYPTSLTYTNRNQEKGVQYASITGMTFTAPC